MTHLPQLSRRCIVLGNLGSRPIPTRGALSDTVVFLLSRHQANVGTRGSHHISLPWRTLKRSGGWIRTTGLRLMRPTRTTELLYTARRRTHIVSVSIH